MEKQYEVRATVVFTIEVDSEAWELDEDEKKNVEQFLKDRAEEEAEDNLRALGQYGVEWDIDEVEEKTNA